MSLTLFADAETAPDGPKKTYRPNFYDLICRSRGAPEGWRWFSFRLGLPDDTEVPPGMTRIEGCVPTVMYLSGKRKGTPNWGKGQHRQVFWITDAEYEAFQQKWSEETGKCIRCMGEGQEWWQWSAAEGNKYRTCRQCSGTGNSSA
jgi:hypothetical protein